MTGPTEPNDADRELAEMARRWLTQETINRDGGHLHEEFAAALIRWLAAKGL